MHHKCNSCVNFTDYYVKQSNYFAMSGCGNCKLKKQRVSRHGTCKEYKLKPAQPKPNCTAILEELEEVLTSLNGIRLILDESEKD